MKFRVLLIMLLALSLPLSGCGLPSDLKKEAEAQNQQILDLDALIKEKEAAYNAFAKGDDFRNFSKYAGREGWSGWFEEARVLLGKARADYDAKAAPLLENDKKDQAPDLSLVLASIRGQLRAITAAADKANTRIAFLKETMADPGSMTAKAGEDFKTLQERVEDSSRIVEKAKTDYPPKAQDLDARFAPIGKLADESGAALSKARDQLALHANKGADADYAVLGDSCAAIGKNLSNAQTACEALEKRTAQLYHSYSKMLNDMRTDYFAMVGRTSWDNNAEYDRDNDYAYSARQVDEDAYEVLAVLPENVLLASYRGGLSPLVDETAWEALRIDPTENMSPWDDEAEFWLSDLDAKFYHKYIVLEDGVKKETDWVPVEEGFFEQFEEALGMTILSKPYGMYEDEILTQPAPPGMAFVNNPKYGEWKQDSSGHSFWHWYGQYAFFRAMMGGGYYSRGEYDRWNRDYRGRRPYYGTGADAYGTNSPRGRAQYSGSHYGRSGGFSTQSPSVRGSGPTARSGGPGGGGK